MLFRKVANYFGARNPARLAARKGPRVLLYHRVFSPLTDPQLLCVSPENFRAQMEWLSENCFVVSVSEMLQRALRNDLPANAASVTFDDGYFDNLAFAKPILEDTGVSATVFVSSGFIDSEAEMWWDDLEKLLLQGSPSEWNVTQPVTNEAQKEYIDLCAKLKFSSPQGRREQLDALRKKTGAGQSIRESHRGLTLSGVRQLAANGIVEIGGHTLHHIALSATSVAIQRSQIAEDKARLEQVVGKSVHGFAYPFGTETEFDAQTADIVRSTGYELACANVPGPVTRSTDPYSIPREIVRDWDRKSFCDKVSGWLYA